MNRYFHLVLISVSAFLMVVLLMIGADNLTPAYSAGTTFKVPGDYDTIQEAVDTAADGDTIMVASGTYNENIDVTQGITLTGGWDASFTTQTPGTSVIDGQELGRVISITCTTSDTVVTVDGFTIVNGDASGLGAPAMPVYTEASSLSRSVKLGSSSDSPTDRAARLQTNLLDLSEQGLYPGGSAAYQAAMARLEELSAQLENAQNRQVSANAPTVSSDAGGGIYSWNASLHLINSTIEWNTASQTNDSYGGGVFVGQSAPNGTVIADNVIQFNTASVEANGSGGGLYLHQAPGALVKGNEFRDNVGTQAGGEGVGGGLSVDDSQNVWVDDNLLTRNTAHAGWDCPAMFGGGVGGGAQFHSTKSLTITNNIFRSNLGAVHCGSHGGGLHVYIAEDVNISDNQVVDNWGVLFQVYSDDYGGGMSLETIESITVAGNEVRGNTTAMSSLPSGIQLAYGGGMFGYQLNGGEFLSNSFSGNAASVEMKGNGGGLFLEGSEGDVIAENTISENTASLLGEGLGGGVLLRDTIGAKLRHNRFEANRGSVEGTGIGGGLNVESYGPHSFDTNVDGNLFLDNQASGDPGRYSSGGAGAVVTHGFEFTNNVVAGNTAGEGDGLTLDLLGETETGEVTNNTFDGNGANGVLVGQGSTSILTFTNNIVTNHTVGISVTEGMTAVVRYTLWYGNGTDIAGGGTVSQTHAVSGAPAFVDPALHDYHLTGASAAVDAGDPAGVPPAPPEDLDGVERPQFARVDIGAYEWGGEGHIYLPVVYKNLQPQIGWIVGESLDGYGTIVLTTDGGENWLRQGSTESIPDVALSSVSTIDACNAWVVGGESDGFGVILHTEDGGHSWIRQGDATQVPENSSAVYAINNQIAWVVGNEGLILYTKDGGETWTRQGMDMAPGYLLQGVYTSDSSHVWVVGGKNSTPCPDDICGIILHSTDGGKTWEQQFFTPSEGNLGGYLISVHGINSSTAWAVGNASVLHTTDGGETWENITPLDGGGFFDWNGVFAVNNNDVWVARDNDGIFNHDGSQWHTYSPPPPTGQGGFHLVRVSALDFQNIWVTGTSWEEKNGIILHSANGGKDWDSQRSWRQDRLVGRFLCKIRQLLRISPLSLQIIAD